ncbi:MAG TPA: hypothetical protein VFP68_10325 [Burkholderiaceae bacterium]|nr:hypothetical protein [Burkholderiaceae bacterium]
MSLQRINAIVPLAGVRGQEPRPAGMPSAGSTVQVALDDIQGADLVGHTPEGFTLRLLGLGTLAAQLTRGDVLLMRVLSSAPQLELALIETRSQREVRDTAATDDHALSAMRDNPLRWRAAPKADALEIAQRWQAHVRDAVLRMHPARQPSSLSGGLSVAPAGVPEGAGSPEVLPQRCWLPFDPAGSTGVWMHWAQPPARQRAAKRRRVAALRLDCVFNAIGPTALLVQLCSGGLLLSLAVETPAAQRCAEAVMRSVAAAFASAGLRLLRWQVFTGSAALQVDETAETPAAPLGGSLLRSAAQAVLALAEALQPTGLRVLR